MFGKTFESTLNNLIQVFDRFRSANLKPKPKKCELFKHSVSFLGHVVSHEGVSCDPSKISDVRDWETPRNASELRSFLGLASYYRRYVEGFASFAAPLNDLLRKNRKFEWTESRQRASELLKKKLITTPVLGYPQGGKYILDTDASAYGIGAVLSEIQDGQEQIFE